MYHKRKAYDRVFWLGAQTDGRDTYVAARMDFYRVIRWVDWKERGVRGYDEFTIPDKTAYTTVREKRAKARVIRRWKRTALDLARIMARRGLEKESFIDVDDLEGLIEKNHEEIYAKKKESGD